MNLNKQIKQFYLNHLPDAKIEGHLLKAPCPFCQSEEKRKVGVIAVYLNPDSFLTGYFRCSNRCLAGGFHIYFGRLRRIPPQDIPGCDPDRDPFVRDMVYPSKNLNSEVIRFKNIMNPDMYAHFSRFGVSKPVLNEMNIGFNRRYLVYPYFLENRNCYAARCVLPKRDTDAFWHGDERFFAEEFRIFNVQEIERCEGGALFITDGEDNMLLLRELGYPGIAVPHATDFEVLQAERLEFVNHIIMITNNTPEAQMSARSLAVRLGFKTRIVKWPYHYKRGYHLRQLAIDKGAKYRAVVTSLIKSAKSYSPFTAPQKEHSHFSEMLDRDMGKKFRGMVTGFEKLDIANNGIRGINIMGGQPKSGKSCIFMQIATEVARKKTPVIYYDFENGRQKIYTRTICRISRLSETEIRAVDLDKKKKEKLRRTLADLKDILVWFRVVTDRKLTPETMRKHIDFIQHETRQDAVLVVLDSLQKIPFKNLSERRTGIDSWLRHMEAIRDEQNAAFLVISELTRSLEGRYDERPDIGSFKGSGDIEYSADNAMIFMPHWNAFNPITTEERQSTLWMVASRENSPGKIADYRLDYPYWGFSEL